jgi:hypothetical protein
VDEGGGGTGVAAFVGETIVDGMSATAVVCKAGEGISVSVLPGDLFSEVETAVQPTSIPAIRKRKVLFFIIGFTSDRVPKPQPG